ncbi:MAG: hypothetical protein RL238_689 [Actinomycetota bacterium]|jgi:anti-anti-sigma regulatory factor
MNTATISELGVHTTDHADGSVSVVVTGSLTVLTAAQLRRRLHATAEQQPATIHVDLTDLNSLDAAGIVAVTAPLLKARRNGVRAEVSLPVRPSARDFADQAGVLPLLNALS